MATLLVGLDEESAALGDAGTEEDHLEGSPHTVLPLTFLRTIATRLMKWKYTAHCQTSATGPEVTKKRQ